MKASGVFKVTTWDEKPCDDNWGGTKVTRASVTQSAHGDIEGETRAEYLMVYRNDGTASFLVAVRVAGKLGGRLGGFVLEGNGTYADGTAKCTLTVAAGAGSGELVGLRGKGGFVARHAEYPNVPFTLEYDFE